jgi:Right handed beta helix region
VCPKTSIKRFALFFFLFAQSVLAGAQMALYVSPGGSGPSFSLAQPGNLFDARNYIRTISTGMTGDITVYLLGGTYQLTNSFQLWQNSGASPTNDSGTGGFNIIYRNYSGQAPIISGGIVVSNWTLVNAATNIWGAFVGTGINSRQLYVNGVRAIRARSALNPSGFSLNSAGTGFWTTNTAMQFWGNQTNIEIVQRHNWKQLRCPIASISGTNIVMQKPGWTYAGTTPTPGRPWNGNGTVSLTGVSWVENAYELLASPGMWYLNEATGWLYYIPRPGENLTNGAVVVLPVVEKLVDAEGAALTTPIHNIVLSGLTFEYATWLLPGTSSGYADNQTSIMWSGPTNALKTLGNVSFQTAANIQITNCVFEHLGGSAIDFGGGAHTNLIIGNYIDDISSDGISLGEVTDYAATAENQMTDANTIQDNFIRRPGQEYEDAIGIWIGYSKNTIVAHNDVDNTPYTGISLGWGWGTSTYAQNNQVLSNYVGKVMQTLTDGGSVYSLSAQTNSWHIGNYYKDSCWHGIYLDEGSAWWTAVSNVFDNINSEYIDFNSSNTNTTGGVLNNHNNTVTNNFSNVTSAASESRGVNDVITNTVFSTGQFWSAPAQQIILSAGLEPAFAQIKSPVYLVNDTEPNFDHVPSDWTYSSARDYGEYHSDVHYDAIAGQYVQYTFTAAGITWIGDQNNDESNVDVYLDGTFQQTVNGYNATRVAQAQLFTATNLAAGPHTLKLVNDNGSNLIVDAFAVTPVNFWITATPNALAAGDGYSATSMVKLATFDSYSGTTVFSASGLPAGATASFNPPSVTGAGFSTLTITAGASTPAGNYTFDINGVGGGVTNLVTANFVVSSLPVSGTITADTDVITNGTFVYACHWTSNNETVNGVTFTGTTSTTGEGNNVGLSGVTGGNYGSYSSSSTPFSALSAAYQTVLKGGDWSSSTTALTLTLSNLTAAHEYAAQIWVNDSRTDGIGRSETVTSGSSVTLTYNSTGAAGGVGQYAIVTFTPTGATETITLLGNASSQINALQVRDITGIYAPLAIGSVTFNAGTFNLNFSGPSGQAWQVLASTNLLLPLANWSVLTSGVFGPFTTNFTDLAATNEQEFYQVVSP